MRQIAKKRIAKLMKKLPGAFSKDGFIYTQNHNVVPDVFLKEWIVAEKVWIDNKPYLKWGK